MTHPQTSVKELLKRTRKRVAERQLKQEILVRWQIHHRKFKQNTKIRNDLRIYIYRTVTYLKHLIMLSQEKVLFTPSFQLVGNYMGADMLEQTNLK